MTHRQKKIRITRFSILTLMSAALMLFDPNPSHARDLQGRLGLGYNAEFANSSAANGAPAISVKYAFTKDLVMEGVVGVTTSKPGNSVYGVKGMKNIFYETNLNFYGFFGGGVLSATGKAASEFLGGFGTEFFIPGLESIGLSMEVGGSLHNLSGSFVLRTLGFSFLNAGMHFYF